jgi:hypothetical protein
MIRHKFHAQPTECDGIKFASKAEAKYYAQLKLRQRAGEVVFFLRQVPIHLPGNIKYVCDFMEFHVDGAVHFVDVKGASGKKGLHTPMFIAKRKIVESLYPIKIEEA